MRGSRPTPPDRRSSGACRFLHQTVGGRLVALEISDQSQPVRCRGSEVPSYEISGAFERLVALGGADEHWSSPAALAAEVVHEPFDGAAGDRDAVLDSALDAQVALSFGSIGDAFDNAAMEAFWSTLKRELAHIHGRQHWPSRAELRAALFDYIEAFYNRARHQAGLGHLTPAEF